MKHLTLSFAFILSLTFSIQAQLKGTLIDQEQQPIEFANIALYSLPDSVMITGTVSDEKGNFALDGDGTNEAFLKVSFIGYETQTVPAKPAQTIVMRAEASQLGEVVVSGSRKISFDLVVRTMYETGKAIHASYRETAEGGLAKLYEQPQE